MKIKIKIPRRDLEKEEYFKEKLKEQYLEWKEELLNKAKNVKDLKELRKIIDELGKEQFDWDSATGDWLERSDPYEVVCIEIRLPGLKNEHERHSIYGVLAFSKGLTDSFDHMGDLERLVYVKNNNNKYFSYSTVGHGYLELFPEILKGNYSFNDLLRNEEYVFEVGDHSLCTLRDDTKIKLGIIPFIDIFRIIRTNIYKDYVYKEIPILTHDDLEDKLEINWYDYANEVIKIDNFIKNELKKYSLIYRIKRSFKKLVNYIKKRKKLDYFYLLNAIRSALWNVAPLKQQKIIIRLKKILEKYCIENEIESKLPKMLESLQVRLDNLVDPVEFLKWLADHDPDRLSRKFGMEILRELKPLELQALPFALYMILNKSLDDIAYPEKLPPIEKGKRIIFWIGGNIYRLLRAQFANLSKDVSDRFKNLTFNLDNAIFKKQKDENN